jgi:lipopolysaccharide export system protein LptA
MTDSIHIDRKQIIFRLIALSTIVLSMQVIVTPDSHADTALPAEKVVINADHVTMNIKSGNSTYTGNVRITQGELKLTGDKVTLIQQNNEIERMTVIGNPAHYNHVTEDGQTIKAESEKMVYSVSENKLVLTINAKLKQPDHQVSSQKITYDTEKKIIIAGDPEKTEQQRVNITLTPQKTVRQADESDPATNKD